MNLYHFTCVNFIESILGVQTIFRGFLPSSGGMIKGACVWFTSSPFPEGHGLPFEKRRLTSKEEASANRLDGFKENRVTFNKTQVRITIDSEKLEGWLKDRRSQLTKSSESNDFRDQLISFEKWCRRTQQPKGFAKHVGLTAICDVDSLTDDELRRASKKKDNTREHTWYLCFAHIPSELIDQIDFLHNGVYVPYEFEVHGRSVFKEYGSVAPGVKALKDLVEIFPDTGVRQNSKAYIWCENPNMKPYATFRGNGALWEMELDDPSVIRRTWGDLPINLDQFQEWVIAHRSELHLCWKEAVELYYGFHPEKRLSHA